MSFATYLAQLAPTTFRRAKAAAYLLALGQQLDGSVDGDYVGRGSAALDWGVVARAKAAVKARFPGVAPSDALEEIGLERGMPRGPGESDASYGARLLGAWNTWPWAGTAFGLLNALAAAGYAAEVRIQNRMRYALDAAGALVVEQRPAGEWRFDTSTAFWSRFALVLVPPFPFTFGISAVTSSPASGIPLVVPSGTAVATNLAITIAVVTGSGPAPAIASYSVTGDITDSGDLNGGASLTNDTPYPVGATGISVSFPSSGYSAGWSWTFTASGFPADGSDDALRVQALERKWKASHATCAGIYVIESGETWDFYPTGETWDSPAGTWDGDEAVLTTWSP